MQAMALQYTCLPNPGNLYQNSHLGVSQYTSLPVAAVITISLIPVSTQSPFEFPQMYNYQI